MNEIRRAFQVLVAATVLLYVAVAALFVFGYLNATHRSDENHRLAQEGQQAHDALCATKANLRERIDSTQRFLDKGGHIPGVPDSLIQAGQTRDRKTLLALRPLNCKGD